MEKYYKNKKWILIGIVVILILINLTALGTLGYHKYKSDHNYKLGRKQMNVPIEKREDRIKQFVKKELNLNDKQCSIYFRSMDENFAQTKLMLKKIAECKKQIMEQTIKENPDTLKLNQLCDSLGYFNNKMQRATNRHFIGVMNLLDSSQKVKLKEILIRRNDKDWNNSNNNRNRGYQRNKAKSEL
jgi:hypothetical protein